MRRANGQNSVPPWYYDSSVWTQVLWIRQHHFKSPPQIIIWQSNISSMLTENAALCLFQLGTCSRYCILLIHNTGNVQIWFCKLDSASAHEIHIFRGYFIEIFTPKKVGWTWLVIRKMHTLSISVGTCIWVAEWPFYYWWWLGPGKSLS